MVRIVSDTSTMYSTAQAEQAEMAKEILREKFLGAQIDIFPLSPAFITQGGPGCVAVQVVKG